MKNVQITAATLRLARIKLQLAPRPLTAAELATELDKNISTTRTILRTLAAELTVFALVRPARYRHGEPSLNDHLFIELLTELRQYTGKPLSQAGAVKLANALVTSFSAGTLDALKKEDEPEPLIRVLDLHHGVVYMTRSELDAEHEMYEKKYPPKPVTDGMLSIEPLAESTPIQRKRPRQTGGKRR